MTFNYPLQYSKELGNINAKKQLCMQLLSESLNGKCEYPTQPRVPFSVMLFIQKVLSLIFIKELVLVLCLSFSIRYLVKLKLLQNLKNKITWDET